MHGFHECRSEPHPVYMLEPVQCQSIDLFISSENSAARFSQSLFQFPPLYTDLLKMDHWRMQLNNYCQRNNLQHFVAWSNPVQTGPQNAPTWTISVFFNQVEYGRGSAINVGAAREIAAEMALRALWSQRGN
ncbi:hypothetical protein C8Q74DRAFT_445503 [Fomes fomentarius]|nr:hypothetical protein C8Q74DRAFT_445503 [Fomes fomentarius]